MGVWFEQILGCLVEFFEENQIQHTFVIPWQTFTIPFESAMMFKTLPGMGTSNQLQGN